MCSLDILALSYPSGHLKTTTTTFLPSWVSRELHCSPLSCSSQNLEVIHDHYLYFVSIYEPWANSYGGYLLTLWLTPRSLIMLVQITIISSFISAVSWVIDLLGLLFLSLLPLLEAETNTSISFLLSTRYIRAVQIAMPQDQQWLLFSLAVHCLPRP